MAVLGRESPLERPLKIDPEDSDLADGPIKSRFVATLGPGLITGAADDDPSGIATYSQAGAQFGYGLLWTTLYSLPFMAAIQMICARIGRTTGLGIAGVVRRYYPNWLLQSLVGLLLIANVLNLGADLGAMADAMTLIVPGSRHSYVVLFGAICVAMQMMLRYARYVTLLKWLTASLLSYIVVLGIVRVDWIKFATHLLVPEFELSKPALTAIVAVFGTTISPYLFFWQSAEEAEDLHAFNGRRNLLDAPEQGAAALHRIEFDTVAGMIFSNIIAMAVMLTAAAVLNPSGITDIRTSAEAAQALRPLAGDYAADLFAIGIIGIGLLAVPVLAGSSAYAIGEARRWPVGFLRRFNEARAFYGTVAASTIVGTAGSLAALDPIKALYWSAVVNGVVAIPIMFITVRVASRTDILGRFAVSGTLRILGWMSTILMSIAVFAMFASLLIG